MGNRTAFLLFYPKEDTDIVRRRFAEAHNKRFAILLPIVTAIAIIEIGLDVLKLDRSESVFAFHWYLSFDIGFFVLQLVAWAAFLLKREVDGRALFVYLLLVMTWAALTSAVEMYRYGSVITVITAVMAVSVLAYYSLFVFSALMFLTDAVFIAACLAIPGLKHPTMETLVFLTALSLVSIGVSRALFSAAAESILATERLGRANRELQAMQLKLIQKEKFAAIGQLSAGITHEVNNPLGFIKSNFSTLEQGFQYIRSRTPRKDGDEAYAHFMDGLDQLFLDTKDGFRRIGEVIENLHSFAHELPEGDFSPYNLVRGVEGALVIARNRYKNVARIERNLAPVPDIQARGSEINQVLLNLLLNAVTAVASAGTAAEGVITVSTATDGTSVFFEISDTGPGVPESLRTRIFDPFFTTKPIGQGMGLGLSLGWEIIVKRHLGSLDLLDGRPTTFRITLPIRRTGKAD